MIDRDDAGSSPRWVAQCSIACERGRPGITIDIKRSSAPKTGKGFHLACDDLGLVHRYVVYPGEESYRMSGNIRVTPIVDLVVALEEQDRMSFG